MKALSIKHLTAEDYKKEGEIQWEDICKNFEPANLIVADIDFTELYVESSKKSQIDTMNQASSSVACLPPAAAGVPLPPPLPTINSSNIKSIMPPPPPPPTVNLKPLAQPSKPKVQLAPFHWRPILKPPLVESIWTNLPEIQFNNEEFIEMFKIKPPDPRKALK